jgi:outer membrane protein assembly factor BamB
VILVGRFFIFSLALLVTLSANAQWNRFRGPNGSGVDAGSGYPVEFSPSKSVVWKTAVPLGQSSPIVVGGRVYLTASDATHLWTIALDARNGRELWRREIKREHPQQIFRANDPASPTPAADDSGVYAFFAEFGLISYSPDGKERWRRALGPFENFYGMAASPVVAGNLVIQVCDQQTGSFVIALDRATGAQRWKTDRRETAGWATPMVYRPSNGPAELVVLGTTSLESYYLSTGERRWWRPIATEGSQGTPVSNGDTILIATEGSSQPVVPPFETMLEKYDKDKDGRLSSEEFRADKDMGEHFGWIDDNHDGFIDRKEWDLIRAYGVGEFGVIAVRPDGAQGKLPDSAVRWRFQKNLPYIPASLVYQGVFYMVRTGGIVTSLDPESGKVLKQGRTRDALGEYYASPVAADGKLYLASEEGKMSVLKAGGEWDVLAVNDMGEEIHATPALSGGRVYVRTRSAVYCFGK